MAGGKLAVTAAQLSSQWLFLRLAIAFVYLHCFKCRLELRRYSSNANGVVHTLNACKFRYASVPALKKNSAPLCQNAQVQEVFVLFVLAEQIRFDNVLVFRGALSLSQ